MKIEAKTVEEYIDQLPEDRQEVFKKLRKIIKLSLPQGFEEKIQYDMISYVVPRKIYPEGYHVDPSQELGFLSIGNQKNHVGIYHSGIYMISDLEEWFVNEYPNHMKTKLDMGKSCIRFKNMKTIPYELLQELFTKVTPEEFVEVYESARRDKE